MKGADGRVMREEVPVASLPSSSFPRSLQPSAVDFASSFTACHRSRRSFAPRHCIFEPFSGHFELFGGIWRHLEAFGGVWSDLSEICDWFWE